MRIVNVFGLASAAYLLCGCSLFAKFAPDCHRPQDYQKAYSAAALKVPEGLDSPNTAGSLIIPTVELAPPPPSAKDQCLEVPPRYKPSPTNKAASG